MTAARAWAAFGGWDGELDSADSRVLDHGAAHRYDYQMAPALRRMGAVVAVAGTACGQMALETDPALDAAKDSPVAEVGTDANAIDGDVDVADAGAGGAQSDAMADAADVPAPAWSAAATMPQGKADHSSALVAGQVVVAGGIDSLHNASVTAAAYDPASGAWSSMPSMSSAHGNACSTLLADGRFLVAGGLSVLGKWTAQLTASAEVFDPAAGAWTATKTVMHVSRASHECALLQGGAVLALGGIAAIPPGPPTASAELLLPAAGWVTTSPLPVGRIGFTATPLGDGSVLIAGGAGEGGAAMASALLFDPAKGAFVSTGSLAAARAGHRAVLLQDGQVLIMGGTAETAPSSGAELYDPSKGVWTTTASMFLARTAFSATLLGSGRVLVAGGNGPVGPEASAEIYDPIQGTWSSAGNMVVKRAAHAATLLPSGKVLVTGGWVGAWAPSDSAELFDPSAL